MILVFKNRQMPFKSFQELVPALKFMFGIDWLGPLQENEASCLREVRDDTGMVVARVVFCPGEDF